MKKYVVPIILAVLLISLFVFQAIYGAYVPISKDFGIDSPWLLPVIALAAIIDSVNPCAFSILFLTIAFLFSLGRSRKHIIGAGLSYIFGIFLVYTLIGLGVIKALSFFGVPNGLAKFGALAMIIFGAIYLAKIFYPDLPIKLSIPSFAHEKIGPFINKATIWGLFVAGILVGLFEFPCTGGPYLFVLALLHDEATVLSGSLLLIFYNVIFVLPLIVALAIASNKNVAQKLDEWRKSETKKGKLTLALIMIILGLIVFLI